MTAVWFALQTSISTTVVSFLDDIFLETFSIIAHWFCLL